MLLVNFVKFPHQRNSLGHVHGKWRSGDNALGIDAYGLGEARLIVASILGKPQFGGVAQFLHGLNCQDSVPLIRGWEKYVGVSCLK